MVIPNRISQEVTQQTIDNVMTALAAIRAELPFLIGLSPKERMRMNKAGDSSQAFIRKSADLAPHIEAFLPRGLDVAEMHKDIAAMDALQPIMLAIAQLAEQLSDTRAVLASEAYSAALEIYSSAKKAQGPLGMEEAVKDLGRRFAQSARPAPVDGTAPGNPAGHSPSDPPIAPSVAPSIAPSVAPTR